MDDTPGRVRDDDADERTRELRSEIEETRVELTETIDAIQDKLRPRNVVANATDRVKSAATERVREMADTASQTAQQAMDYTRQTTRNVTDTARQNPIPLALIGAGAAAWLYNRSRGSSYRAGGYRARGYERDYGYDYGKDRTRDEAMYAGDGEYGLMDRIRNNPIPAALAGVGLSWLAFSSGRPGDYERGWDGSREGSWSGQSRGAAGASGVTQNVADTASQAVARTREYATDTTDSMRRMVRRRQNQLQRMIEENPLLVGAGALMLGAAFGMAVPETETENEWMGEARDNMIERARDMARDAASQVEGAASTVADAAGNIAGKSQ